MDWERLLAQLLQHHRGKTVGVLAGLVFGVLTALFGFWKAAFIVLAIGVGFWVGKRVDDSGGLQEWLERIFRER